MVILGPARIGFPLLALLAVSGVFAVGCSAADPWVFDPDLPLSKNMFPGEIDYDPDQRRQPVKPRKPLLNPTSSRVEQNRPKDPNIESEEENPAANNPGIPEAEEKEPSSRRPSRNDPQTSEVDESGQGEHVTVPDSQRRPTLPPSPKPSNSSPVPKTSTKPKAPPKPPPPKPNKPLVTEAQFRCLFKHPSADKVKLWMPLMNAAMRKNGITTYNQVVMFLAQTGHETDYYKTFKEYTNAGGTNSWCHRYKGGCTFIGRGAIQLTHRYNYEKAGKALGQPFASNPTMVAQPKWAFETAGWFWKANGLGAIADRGDFMQLTRRINGGLTHWVKRKILLEQAKRCVPKGSFSP